MNRIMISIFLLGIIGCEKQSTEIKISEVVIPIEQVRLAGVEAGRHWAKTDKERTTEEKLTFARIIEAELGITLPDEKILGELTYIAVCENPPDINQATITHLVSLWYIRWDSTREKYSYERIRAYFYGFAEGINEALK